MIIVLHRCYEKEQKEKKEKEKKEREEQERRERQWEKQQRAWEDKSERKGGGEVVFDGGSDSELKANDESFLRENLILKWLGDWFMILSQTDDYNPLTKEYYLHGDANDVREQKILELFSLVNESGSFIAAFKFAKPFIMNMKDSSLPGKNTKFTKLKGNQGWKENDTGFIWKKDQLHKDHWDISNKKGIKVKEIDFYGNQIWPNGLKNKNK